MKEIRNRVLKSFEHWGKESLDLHTLFEAGENDPAARTAVFDVVEQLVKEGLLQEDGNEFYPLTDKGESAVKKDE